MKISYIFFPLKFLCFALSSSLVSLYLSQLLQAPSFALYTAATVSYVDSVVSYKDSAKGQSLAFSMTTLGGVIASLFGGYLFDNYTVTTTIIVSVVIATVGAIVTTIGTENTEVNY